MIPRAYITSWSARVRWPSENQIEQDLVLSRLIVEIASDPYLQEELVFRGGSCLHKLHLDSAFRYSEDLDYVRRSEGGIAQLTKAVTGVGERVGMEVQTRIGRHPKIHLRAPFESGTGSMRIKVEVNTFERSPARDLVRLPFSVDSPWFSGGVEVLTYAAPELVASKLRALHQRSKGRDLFDLWLALTHLGVSSAELIECFAPYRPGHYTAKIAELSLRHKLADPGFRQDLDQLVSAWPDGYDIDAAAELLIADVFPLL